MTSAPDPDKDARFTKLWTDGAAVPVIMSRLGISRGGIYRMRVRLGLAPRSRA